MVSLKWLKAFIWRWSPSITSDQKSAKYSSDWHLKHMICVMVLPSLPVTISSDSWVYCEVGILPFSPLPPRPPSSTIPSSFSSTSWETFPRVIHILDIVRWTVELIWIIQCLWIYIHIKCTLIPDACWKFWVFTFVCPFYEFTSHHFILYYLLIDSCSTRVLSAKIFTPRCSITSTILLKFFRCLALLSFSSWE